MLPGREREGAYLNELLNRVRAGHSAAIMVHGEAGVGKTALLNEAFGSVSDLRAAGVESEMELPFAGLQQLCVSMLGHLEDLPLPQADALRTAFGLIEGPPPDRFLDRPGRPEPAVQAAASPRWPAWWTTANGWTRPRRRRSPSPPAGSRPRACCWPSPPASRARTSTGSPASMVGGLRDLDARALLRSVVPWPLDEQVRERILAETRGNPLALLELPRGRSPAELAGGFGRPAA